MIFFVFFHTRSFAVFSGDDVVMTQIENKIDDLYLKKRSLDWTNKLLEKIKKIAEQYQSDEKKSQLFEKTLAYVR